MEYKKIPYVDKLVSPLFFGTARPLLIDGKGGKHLLEAVWERGITAFDTARQYGHAEEMVGEWLEEFGHRDEAVILSKCSHPLPDGTKRVNEKEIRADFAASAEAMHTDYIDIYLLHRDDPEVPVGEIVEVLNAMHAEGKIGAFGGSNWEWTRVMEANEYAYAHNLIPFSVTSPNFGLAEQVRDPWGGGCVTISGPDNAEARAFYEKENMPIIAYSSLGRGLFSGRIEEADEEHAKLVMDEFAMLGYGHPRNYERLHRCMEVADSRGVTVPQVALAWIFAQPLNTFAVVSAGLPERMESNMEALDIRLTEAEVKYLDLQ